MADNTARLGRDKRKTMIVAAAGVSALALMAWLAIGQTVAGFNAQTDNGGNEFQAGTVTISDDDTGSALFVVNDLLPGHSKVDTITVSNTSTAPLKVKLLTSNITETAAAHDGRAAGTGLAENLDVVIKIVTPDTTDTNPTVYNGTLADLATAADWATGKSASTGGDAMAKKDATGDDLVYEITVTLRSTAGNEAENVWPGDTATVNFIWEGRA